ncbi:MAG: putative acetyl-CoA acyltransferase [Candidatus Erwinia impunctatus]|nr:putative acetyl-CoA acyltransferase [Culicoides impunctatus]
MSLIIAARRTAVVPRGGAFSALELHQLAAPVITRLLKRCGIAPAEVDNLIVANALGAGGNPARMLALAAGLPDVPGISVDSQCAGGLDAVMLASALVNAGLANIVIAGGAESYSRRPLRAHTFADGSAPVFYTRPPFAPEKNDDPDMTEAAAALAERYAIGRQEQDEYAVTSHRKALAAADRLRAEIEAVNGVVMDSYTRVLTVKLASRAPQLAGSVSVASTAIEADGAAFCIIVSEQVARRLRPDYAVTIADYQSCGGDSRLPGAAPVTAIRKLLARHAEISPRHCVSEIMEAYAAQAMVAISGSDLHPQSVNLGGGALARGHPIGASGAILVCRLFHELIYHNKPYGLCAIAAAGGIGAAMLLTSKR